MGALEFVLRGALLAVEIALALPLAYLALLSIAALLPRRGAPAAAAGAQGDTAETQLPRIGILVPRTTRPRSSANCSRVSPPSSIPPRAIRQSSSPTTAPTIRHASRRPRALSSTSAPIR